MKRYTLTLALAALALPLGACVENQNPVRVLNAIGFDNECKGITTVYVPSRQVDIGFESVPSFVTVYQLFQAESNFEANTAAGSDPARNDFVSSEVELTYTSEPPATFATERVPYYAVIRAGATADDQEVGLDLIGPQAANTLFQVVQPGGYLVLNVTFKLIGTVSGHRAESNSVTYPVEVVRSGTCPSGTTAARDACGGNFKCVAPTTTP